MTTTSAVSPADVAFYAADRVLGLGRRAARTTASVLDPVRRVAARPPLVPERWQPARVVTSVAREGALRRSRAVDELSRRLDVLLPAVLAEILRRAHLAELLVEYVDLDAVVAAVDLDRAAARLDLGPVLDRVDVDTVVDRVDLDAVALRLDLQAVLDRLDLTALVLERVDLDRLVDAVLARIDLTALVLERVDLDRLVDAVLTRIDLVALAEEVIDGVNLPEIIRESTGSMASDTVHGVRMQGIAADEAVGRAVDRLLLRRGRRPGGTSGPAIPAQGDRAP